MLRASLYGKRDGKQKSLLVLGLTDENMERLKGGEPISLSDEDVRAVMSKGQPRLGVLIMYGATAADLKAQLLKAGLVSENTEERFEGFDKGGE